MRIGFVGRFRLTIPAYDDAGRNAFRKRHQLIKYVIVRLDRMIQNIDSPVKHVLRLDRGAGE